MATDISHQVLAFSLLFATSPINEFHFLTIYERRGLKSSPDCWSRPGRTSGPSSLQKLSTSEAPRRLGHTDSQTSSPRVEQVHQVLELVQFTQRSRTDGTDCSKYQELYPVSGIPVRIADEIDDCTGDRPDCRQPYHSSWITYSHSGHSAYKPGDSEEHRGSCGEPFDEPRGHRLEELLELQVEFGNPGIEPYYQFGKRIHDQALIHVRQAIEMLKRRNWAVSSLDSIRRPVRCQRDERDQPHRQAVLHRVRGLLHRPGVPRLPGSVGGALQHQGAPGRGPALGPRVPGGAGVGPRSCRADRAALPTTVFAPSEP